MVMVVVAVVMVVVMVMYYVLTVVAILFVIFVHSLVPFDMIAWGTFSVLVRVLAGALKLLAISLGRW